MQTLGYSTLQTIGVNPLTGESCAYSKRVLCDLSESGRALVADWLGISTEGFAPNWNSMVGHYPSVASVMLDRSAFAPLMLFALLLKGHQYVLESPSGSDFTGFNPNDLERYPALQEAIDGKAEWMGRLHRNPRMSDGGTVGSRNVHQFTGRAA